MMTPLESASRVGWSEDRLRKLRQMCRLAGIARVHFTFHGQLTDQNMTVSARYRWADLHWNPANEEWGMPASIHWNWQNERDAITSVMRLITDVPGGDW